MRRNNTATPKKMRNTASAARNGVSKSPPHSRLSEDVRLQLKYSDQYVAMETGSSAKRRKVLAVADSLAELHRRLAKLPASARTQLCIEYMPDPNGPLDLPGPIVGA